jgi:diaminohydroxyphosphoribosylaminopyrimidine deaminase/5-amino-6-(5-phosphoribosylamino)uracil reductase
MHPFYDFMLQAVALSREGHPRTAPNPCVGALLVKDGKILAEGRHNFFGGDHAEVELLKDAARKGVNPAECSLVVTLEPCSHYGKTPPCAAAVLEAGIRHVVIGTADPNPRAAGGAKFLSERGVRVECGVAERECLDNIADFLVWQREDRPYVILKLAATLDGRIATRTGESRWISGKESLQRTHELRALAQAVLIGGKTFYTDDPALTCRPEGEPLPATQPLAVIVSGSLPERPENFRLLRERPREVIFLTNPAQAGGRTADLLRRKGVKVWGAEGDYLAEGLKKLRQACSRQVFYLLCEGGGKLGLSMLAGGLADELRLHLSPKIIGDAEARPLFDGLRPESMQEALCMRFTQVTLAGGDLLLQLRRI